MEFEDLKKIWDTQNSEQVYAIDEKTLHQRVIQKNINSKRTAHINETAIIVIGFIVSLFMLGLSVIDDSTVYLSQAVIFLGITFYAMFDRKRRREIAGYSGGSIIEELEQAIRTNDYEIRRQKTMVWWFFAPTLAAMLFNLFKTSGIFSWAVIILMLVTGILGLFVQHKSIKPLLTKKQDLGSLRKLLLNPLS